MTRHCMLTVHAHTGGGLSVNFASDEAIPSFEDYAAALRTAVPELFDASQFASVVTEFGRALVAKAGFFASRVEYVKVTQVQICS
jgi:diaminopimelate decarboxylase